MGDEQDSRLELKEVSSCCGQWTHLLVPDIENDQKPPMSQDSFNRDAGQNILIVGRSTWGALTQSCESGSRDIWTQVKSIWTDCLCTR